MKGRLLPLLLVLAQREAGFTLVRAVPLNPSFSVADVDRELTK